MTVARLAAAAALAAGLVAAARAQVFHASTDAVVLAVTVTDEHQRLVPGLERRNFHVFENGVPQEISHFSRDPEPIALSILLDTSTSMAPKMPIAQDAAIGFARRLGPKDVAQIISFDSSATVLQGFTNDRAALEGAIRKTDASGSTSLYLAIYIALHDLREIPPQPPDEIRRQAIVVLSDGEDTSSPIDYDQVLDQAKRSAVGIWTIGLRSKQEYGVHDYSGSQSDLRRLSQETGGRAFVVTQPSELPSIYQEIANELSNQYVLAYTSADHRRDGAWRHITVTVDRPTTVVRTRTGYFAPSVPR